MIAFKFVVEIDVSSFLVLSFIPVTLGSHLLVIIVNLGLKIWFKMLMRKVTPATTHFTTGGISSVIDKNLKGELYLDSQFNDNTANVSWGDNLHQKQTSEKLEFGSQEVKAQELDDRFGDDSVKCQDLKIKELDGNQDD